jgi:hypothetical protein
VVLSESAARAEGAATANRLLDAYGLNGMVVEMAVDGGRMTVVLEVYDGGRTVTGVGVARASDRSGEP